LIQLGQASLLVYWVHIEFVYGRVSILPKHSQSIRTASLGLLTIFLAMLILAFLGTRMKGRGADVLAWFRSPARAWRLFNSHRMCETEKCCGCRAEEVCH